jgi:hypothetical protein
MLIVSLLVLLGYVQVRHYRLPPPRLHSDACGTFLYSSYCSSTLTVVCLLVGLPTFPTDFLPLGIG